MRFKEQIVQEFPYRCPYCDQVISYDPLTLKEGENFIQCPTCQKTYIKIVYKASEDESE